MLCIGTPHNSLPNQIRMFIQEKLSCSRSFRFRFLSVNIPVPVFCPQFSKLRTSGAGCGALLFARCAYTLPWFRFGLLFRFFFYFLFNNRPLTEESIIWTMRCIGIIPLHQHSWFVSNFGAELKKVIEAGKPLFQFLVLKSCAEIINFMSRNSISVSIVRHRITAL